MLCDCVQVEDIAQENDALWSLALEPVHERVGLLEGDVDIGDDAGEQGYFPASRSQSSSICFC